MLERQKNPLKTSVKQRFLLSQWLMTAVDTTIPRLTMSGNPQKLKPCYCFRVVCWRLKYGENGRSVAYSVQPAALTSVRWHLLCIFPLRARAVLACPDVMSSGMRKNCGRKHQQAVPPPPGCVFSGELTFTASLRCMVFIRVKVRRMKTSAWRTCSGTSRRSVMNLPPLTMSMAP